MVDWRGKFIGVFLILLGLWPFLVRVDSVGKFISSYKFLSFFAPGEMVYQIVLIVLGVLLLWRVRVVAEPIGGRRR
jgi:hypothetical protein